MPFHHPLEPYQAFPLAYSLELLVTWAVVAVVPFAGQTLAWAVVEQEQA